ncbi:MAG: hypothetical protein J6J51_01360, partial [Clostridia bacterium]|nr:hypothetical protein [Clostridia bacterium]
MKQKLRKPVAWLLTFAMLFTMLPGAALAAEAEHLCSCGTDDESIHATTCAAYVQPENPVCYCAEPCTEANEWCDVCGFDYTACTGTEEATSYFTNPTGKEYIPYTGASQVLINATSADSGYTWGYFAYGSSADPLVNFPNSWETPTAADVDRYTIHCFHVDNAVKDDIETLLSQYNGKPNASLTVYIYPVVSTDPVAATGLVADGTPKTLITSEGRVSGGQNGDVLYAVTSSSATKPDSFSTAQPTATEPGTYKVWFKAWAQGPERPGYSRWGITAPDSAARSITVTVADPNACPHEVYKNGFCDCGAYQPAELKNGYYQISNGGQLFWFAKQINEVDRTLSAVLIDDIDLENRPWTPIGSTGESSHNFRGHFDGDGHTIEGLKVEGKRAGLGFFGEVRTGTVENFTIYGEVNVIGSHDYVGGVIGSACGLNSSDHGLERNGATIRNITSYVNL